MKSKLPHPELYILRNFEGTRARLLLAAKDVEVEVVVSDDVAYRGGPRLVDKDVSVTGRAMDEYVHERWPAPCLLTGEPAFRARLRTLERNITEWYSAPDTGLMLRVAAEAYDPALLFYCGTPGLSVVDIALAPLLEATPLGHFARSFQAYGARVVATMYQLTKGQRVVETLAA